ncbi:MAG: hypothetical protein JXA71_14920 [Chitinispirillaceae bacterium]|nr:hypothetical protein [Chitinispirillaceae bacterium]
MPKTKFISGSTVFSKWLNTIFGGGAATWQASTAYAAGDVIELSGGEMLRCTIGGTSGSSEPGVPGALRATVADGSVTWELFGGHLHDEKAFDGSAPKVLLTGAAEVTGTLPVANQVDHTHDGSQRAKIHQYNHIDGVTEGDISLVFPNTQFTTEQTIAARYRRHQALESGKPDVIWLSIKRFTATSNGTGFGTSAQPLPTTIRPPDDIKIPCIIIDNGNELMGAIHISAAGNVAFTLAGSVSGDANSNIHVANIFTASGTKGIPNLEILYTTWS